MSTSSTQSNPQPILVKIVVVGDAAVGKTSLLSRYCDEAFSDHMSATIGLDFKTKTININDVTYKLQIWDMNWQEKYRPNKIVYYRGTSGIFFVYDISDSCSFENVKQWLKEVEQYIRPECVRIVIGNKSDLVGKRQVSFSQAQDFAMKNDIPLFETSCKDNVNVTEAFTAMAEECARMNSDVPRPVGIENQEIVVEGSSWWDYCSIL